MTNPTKWALLLLTAAALTTVQAGTKAAPPPVDCTSVVMGMADCLTYVTKGSTVQKPEGNCCNGLKSVLKTNADCLCQAFKQSASFGVDLDVPKALALPKACHVSAPSAAKCGLSLAPAGAPVSAATPAGAPSSSSIANPPSSGIGASETSPSASPSSMPNSASVTGLPVQLIIAGAAAALFSL